MIFSATTAIYIGGTSYSKAFVGSTQVWPHETDYSREYLTFEIVSSGTIMWQDRASGDPLSLTIDYNINDGGWTSINSNPTTGFTVQAGDIVKFRGTNSGYTAVGNTPRRVTFDTSTAYFNVYGNIMSMIYGDNFIGQTQLCSEGYNFVCFFRQTKAVDASNLVIPAVSLGEKALNNLFIECPNLVYAPTVIPATTVGVAALQGAFARCSNLLTAPELPATVVGDSGYTMTFLECTKLTQAPSILPIQSMGRDACHSMFQKCSSLTTAPELPATALTRYCYYNMFYQCSKLNYIKCYARTGINTNLSTTNWVRSVARTGTFVQVSGVTWPTGNNGIPTSWTKQYVNGTDITRVNDVSGLSVGDRIIFAAHNSYTYSGSTVIVNKIIGTGATNDWFSNLEFSTFNGNDGNCVLPDGTAIFTVSSVANNKAYIEYSGSSICGVEDRDAYDTLYGYKLKNQAPGAEKTHSVYIGTVDGNLRLVSEGVRYIYEKKKSSKIPYAQYATPSVISGPFAIYAVYKIS